MSEEKKKQGSVIKEQIHEKGSRIGESHSDLDNLHKGAEVQPRTSENDKKEK